MKLLLIRVIIRNSKSCFILAITEASFAVVLQQSDLLYYEKLIRDFEEDMLYARIVYDWQWI